MVRAMTSPARFDLLTVLAVAAVSAGALGLALIAQYGFALWPCPLCYWQRIPYIFALALALLALMPAVDAPNRRAVVLLCAALFAVNAGLSLYHVGVEQRWWPGPSECAGPVQELSLDDMLAALNQPGRTGCENPAFVFLGLSMAGYNVIASLILGVLAALAAWRTPWWTDAP
jgi:disulfide bond formation protein DsbB